MSEAALDAALDRMIWLRMVVSIVLSALVLAQFLAGFLYPGCKRKAWLPAGTYAAVLVLLYLIPAELDASFARMAAAACACGVCLLLARGRHAALTVYLIVTFHAVRSIATAIRGAIFAMLFGAFFVPLPAPDTTGRFFAYAWCAFVELVVWLAVLWTGCAVIRHVYKDKSEDLSVRECLLLIAPSAVAIAADLVLSSLRLQATDYLHQSVYIEWNACILELVTFFSILATTALFSRVREARREETRRQLLASQLADMHAYISDLESLHGRMRSFRHDMAGHLQTLNALSASGDVQAASNYARSGMGALFAALPDIQTGNPVTDVILSRLAQMAQEKQIAFECAFHWPKNAVLDAFDVGVVLHNAGTNALRAAGGCQNAFVSIRSFFHRGSFVLEVQNRCRACPLQDPITGLPVRPAGEGQGTGILNIRSVAEKYEGTVRACCEKDVFTLTVLLASAHTISQPAHNTGR